MAARRPSIDLLAREDFAERSIGRLLLWILTVGRYIVIFTELIVIAGFVTRVILDRNLTHVNEDLFEQKALLASYQPVELRLRRIDQQFTMYSQIRGDQLDAYQLLDDLTRITPVDLRYEFLDISKEGLDIRAVALSPEGFASLITQLQADPKFSDLLLNSVQTGGPQDPSLQFGLTAELKSNTPVKTAAKVTEEETF